MRTFGRQPPYGGRDLVRERPGRLKRRGRSLLAAGTVYQIDSTHSG